MRQLKACLFIIFTVFFIFELYAENNNYEQKPLKSMKKVFSIKTNLKRYDPSSVYDPKYFFIQEIDDSITFGVVKKDMKNENPFLVQFINNSNISYSKEINRFYGFPRNYLNSTFIEGFSEDRLQWVIKPNNLSQYNIIESSEMSIFLIILKKNQSL